ncbi:MarC family protein [Alloalcanivorax gelatiniphagus]|uniref:UPF0056 membrane protein n=1 Tax=Alloalcanivorax gelatiniphagus TaxID=1194167 RepID=A0ABY2XIS6_9GAMM|nr:MarC family protein [Alloalcanivorax gelatiniphagus]TMW10924.1 MarC family protein [Alloalcanivorax gelatiniphagus]
MLDHALTVFMAFFAIMNPIANTAVFAGLAGSETPARQRMIATKAVTITFIVVVLFALLGKTIFALFDITLPALRITGGVLVFLVGYHMLQGSPSKLHTGEDDGDTDIATSPLAVPLLAGPGTIATAMNYSVAGGWPATAITCLAFLALCIITFICFIFSARIINLIGENGLSITTRLMGLILAVIGTQMLVAGVGEVLHLSAGT